MENLIDRPELTAQVTQALRRNPVVALRGPRQCGKTTLARQIAEERGATWFDLEDPRSARRLEEPMTTLEPLAGLVVIDEAQLRPALFPVLRVLADRRPQPARFLLLGSASPELMRDTAETLAGRVELVEMAGFSLAEAGAARMRSLWLRGGFPRSWLAGDDEASIAWRENFIQTFLERDLPRLGVQVPATTLRRFWSMVAHYHGQIWNASELGRSLGEAHTTVKRHLDILTGALVLRQLPPWFENLGKRQVKSPKVYLRDSGLFHSLQGIETWAQLESHPKLGAAWEGFALEEVLRVAGGRDAYFWSTQSGAELDLLLFWRGRRVGVEFKYGDAPGLTKSMMIAREDLKLDRLFVVYPGRERFALRKDVEVVPLAEVPQMLRSMRPPRSD